MNKVITQLQMNNMIQKRVVVNRNRDEVYAPPERPRTTGALGPALLVLHALPLKHVSLLSHLEGDLVRLGDYGVPHACAATPHLIFPRINGLIVLGCCRGIGCCPVAVDRVVRIRLGRTLLPTLHADFCERGELLRCLADIPLLARAKSVECVVCAWFLDQREKNFEYVVLKCNRIPGGRVSAF